MTIQRATNERSLLPRGLIARQSFQFAIGQYVRFHGELGVVLDRSHTFAGRELYHLSFDNTETPERFVLAGQYLQPLPAPYAAALMAA